MISIGDVLKVVGWIKAKWTSRQHRHELEQGLATELHELRFTLANALLQLRTRLRDFDQATLDLIRPIHLSYTARGVTEAQIISVFKQMLTRGDSELIRIANAHPGDPTKVLRPVPYQAPLLTAQMNNPAGVPAAIRQRLVDIHSELHLFNQQVAFVQQAHDRTFDSTMSAANYAANDNNLKKGTEKLTVRTASLVTAINTLLAPDGSFLD